MYIKSVTIEGLHNVARKTYRFDEHFNYLHGLNGAGKSTVLQAIQLALLGYIPGTDKNKSSIFAHASSRLLNVTLVLDDNGEEVTVIREWIKSGTNILPSFSITPASYDIEAILKTIELPIFNFADFVGMTANKLKDWFINFLPASEFKTDWARVLAEDVKQNNLLVDASTINAEALKIENYGLNGVSEIRTANEYFKSMVSMSKQELQRITSTIQSLIYYEDAKDVDKLQLAQDITDARVKQKAAMEYDAISSANARVYGELYKYADLAESVEKDPYYTELNSQQLDLANQAKELDGKISSVTDQCKQLQAEISNVSAIADSSGVCPYTKTECDSVRKLIDDAKAQLEEKRTAFGKIDSELNALQTSRRDLANKFTENATKILEIKHRYETCARLTATLQKLPDDLTELDQDTAYWNNRVAELTDLQSRVIANEQYSNLIDTMTKEKFNVSTMLDAFKSWEKLTSVNGLQSHNEGANPFETLIADMQPTINELFGEGWKTTFITEGKSNSFTYGLIHDGVYCAYDMLSSGEKCLFNLALLISIIKFAECPLKLVMIDDSFDHLDDNNIDKVFESLLNMKDIQMIFAGVKLPSFEQYKKAVHEIERADYNG